MLDSSTYVNWQNKLVSNRMFRLFWLFWGVYSVLAVFAVGAYLLARKMFVPLLVALLAFVLARLVISPLIYLLVKRQRPYQVSNFDPYRSLLFSMPTTRANGFPSDHAASFMAIALAVGIFFPAIGMVLVVITLLNGIGRVVLGYHYPSHILAGWLVGVIAVFLAHWFVLGQSLLTIGDLVK